MSEPGIYRNGTTGQLRSYAIGRETVSEIQGIEPLAIGTVVNLFTTATEAINFGTSVAADKNITIGPAGNQIIIDNTTGSEKITHDGDVSISGTETVTGAASFLGNVTVGDTFGDTLDVNATTNFDADVTLTDATTLTLGTSAPVTVDTTWARVSADLTFDGVGAHAITQADQDLTVSATGAADLLLTGGDHVLLTTGTALGDAFVVNTNALYVDGPTGNVIVGGVLGLPSGNEAALTVNQSVADDPVITLKAGAVSETSILSGSTAPTTGVAAPRGSIYLLTTGALYIKVNTLDTQWSPVGTVGGNTLQTAYDQVGGDTIDMSISKDLVFRTNETGGTESDFLVETSGNDAYLLADASAGNIDLGSSAIAIRALNDITMAGVSPVILADSVDLTLQTTTSGDIVLSAFGGVGIGTATPQATAAAVATVSGSDDHALALENTGDSAVVEILTGTDTTGISAQAGSLYLLYEATGSAKAYLNTSAAAAGVTWTEISLDAAVDLQDAYNNGQTIALVDSSGDMVITIDEAAAVADWTVTGASGNYLSTDASGAEVVLGSAGVAFAVNSPVGSMGLDTGNYMMSFIAPTGTLNFDTANGTKIIAGGGTNPLIISNTGAAGHLNLSVDNTGTMTLTTVSGLLSLTSTNGNIDIAPSGTGHVFVQNASNEGLEVADTGEVTLLGGSATLSISDGSGGTGFTMDGTSGYQLDNSGVVDKEIGIAAGGDVDIDAGLNSATNGGDITLDAVKGSGGGGIISLDAQAASNFTVDAGSLTLSTTTSGDVTITAAGDTGITGAGNITITTDTAGDNETMMLLTGSDDPTSVAKSANRGSLYLRDDAAEGTLFLKQDDGSTTAWDQVATLVSPVSPIILRDAGGIFVAGAAVYLDASGDAVATDADVAASSVAIGFAIDPAPTGAETGLRIQLAGEADVSSTLTTLGVYVFLDVTAGDVTQTAPVAVGDTVLKMGIVTATGAGTSKVIIQIGESSLN